MIKAVVIARSLRGLALRNACALLCRGGLGYSFFRFRLLRICLLSIIIRAVGVNVGILLLGSGLFGYFLFGSGLLESVHLILRCCLGSVALGFIIVEILERIICHINYLLLYSVFLFYSFSSIKVRFFLSTVLSYPDNVKSI